MTITAARYADWKAPKEDGQVLVWPPAEYLLQETQQNATTLAVETATVQGVPIAKLRANIRTWLGITDQHQPLIATGHQTELYHPGVWIKDAAINAIADRCGGNAFHFAVDTDQPKHLNIKWPGTTFPVTDDAAVTSADWSGLLAPPSPEHLSTVDAAFQDASANWKFRPMLRPILDSLRRSALEPVSLSAAITNAQHELDWSLGLKHHAMLVSPMLYSHTYLVFVHHVLARADQFATDYNRALDEYRRETGITNSMRPMPDLQVNSDVVEVPFWLDDLSNGTRKRAQVRQAEGAWALLDGNERFVFVASANGESAASKLESWLRSHQLRISPRALTLTTFLRLLVVDQFIHGIGGGRYDQVTDRLLSSHFKIDPPRFAVATGTLYFPGAVGRSRVCLPCVAMEGHRLKHNLLGDRKKQIIQKINEMPRKSVQRSLAFHNMHGALMAAAVDHPLLREWSARFETSQLQARDETVIFDRELFYAMQSQERLVGLIEQTKKIVGR